MAVDIAAPAIGETEKETSERRVNAHPFQFEQALHAVDLLPLRRR